MRWVLGAVDITDRKSHSATFSACGKSLTRPSPLTEPELAWRLGKHRFRSAEMFQVRVSCRGALPPLRADVGCEVPCRSLFQTSCSVLAAFGALVERHQALSQYWWLVPSEALGGTLALRSLLSRL